MSNTTSVPARLAAGKLLAAALLATTCTAHAQQADAVRPAIEEAVSVHAIATAARLCSQISETELNRAANRMDQVHTARLDEKDRETYLILRGSSGFRNTVFASALRRFQGGCSPEVGATWRDVDASLVFANAMARESLAGVLPANAR